MIDGLERRTVSKALLVGIVNFEQQRAETDEHLRELAELTDTFGTDVVGTVVVRLDRPRPRFLIGSGKAQEIVQTCLELGADIIIFDDTLSPSQQRNWEKLANLPVIDRQEVIIDIFASRASTQEAVLQISLAKSQYMLPRLKRAWSHLDRQRGGVGVRGEGETQLEVDARLVRDRIAKLQRELDDVRTRRAQQRKRRRRVPVPNAAIVGYTNAGKSSLLNYLTAAEVLVEDKLFATLDPTTRRIQLPNNQLLLLTDTVGFIRKLPHNLVEAFKATLEEAALSDFLVHVLDATSPVVDHHYETTCEVLAEIGADDLESIIVFNKIDLLDESYQVARLRRRYPDAVLISARTGAGLAELAQRMGEILDLRLARMQLQIPMDRYELVALLHRTSTVHTESYEDDCIFVTASIPDTHRHDFVAFERD